MKKNIIDLIDDENLENALALREKYINNASLTKKAAAFRIMKRISAACLALLFLLIPASAFLMQEFPPHAYRPYDNPETKASFKEMNDILGAEHLYNRLPEEYTTERKILYTTASLNHDPSLNWSENFAANGLTDISMMQKMPMIAEISQEYPNGDRLRLQLRFHIDDSRFYTGDAYTEVGGVTVHLGFEGNEQYARFSYQGNIYTLTLYSENTDITYYLKILLEVSK